MRPVRAVERANVHMFAMMAGVEGLAVLRAREQRRHRRRVRAQIAQVGERGDDRVERARRIVVGMFDLVGFAGGERGAVRDVQVGVLGRDEFVDLAVERTAERLAQLRHEEQRAAEEDDGAVDRASRGEAGDRLRRDGREDRRGQVGFGGAVVDERLQVGLREDAAARRDRIQVHVMLRHLVEAGRVGVQQC